MAKSKFARPGVRTVNARLRGQCSCLCGNQVGAGGGTSSGGAKAQASAQIAKKK